MSRCSYQRTALHLLSCLLLLLIPAVATAQSEISISLTRPEPDERFWLTELSVPLAFTVEAARGLERVEVEVVGPHTGVFFEVCGADTIACEGDAPTYPFALDCPVFEGENMIAVDATDSEGQTAKASVRIQVRLSEVVAPVEPPPPAPVVTPTPTPEPSPAPEARERYDLLILTHKKPAGEDWLSALQPLVQHKNKTGMRTRLLRLGNDVYEVPKLRGRDHPEIIKKAIAEARLNWGIRYVMLVGDSDRFPVRYTKIYDLGHWGDWFAPSDLYYGDLFRTGTIQFDSWDADGDELYGEMQSNFPASYAGLNLDKIDLVPDVAVGRVPVSNRQELVTYVQKVIQYETNADPSWFKKALLISGNYPWSSATSDIVAGHLATRSFAVDKQYHEAVWPGTSMAQRHAIVENALNSGVGFVSYVGHGDGVRAGNTDGGDWGGWWDYTRIPYLSNQWRLPIVVNAACNTGMFHYGPGPYFARWGFVYQTPINPAQYRWAPEPTSYSPSAYDVDGFAENLLVKSPAGAIGFIGSYTGTQGQSHTLVKFFFEAYASGADVFGDAWSQAQTKFVNKVIKGMTFTGSSSWHVAAEYHHIHKMLLFGDPSLRLGGLLPDLEPLPGPHGLCQRRDGKLLVRVFNKGYGTARASRTEVDFLSYGRASLATPPLQGNATYDLLFDIPGGCFDADCDFTIRVDAGAEVAETDEANNVASGVCTG